MTTTTPRNPTPTTPTSLPLSELTAAARNFGMLDPGPDPFFDEDPIPEIAAAR